MRNASLFFIALCIGAVSQNTLTYAQPPTPTTQNDPAVTVTSISELPDSASPAVSSTTADADIASPADDALTPRAFLPVVIGGTGSRSGSCATTSTSAYDVIPIDGKYYKDNRITDENADFRLSILGYKEVNEPLTLIDYNGGSEGDAPRLHGVFEPNRLPQFKRAYLNYQWNWNDGAGSMPPYGSQGPLNDDLFFKVTVLDLAATVGEKIYIPERTTEINSGNVVAMVLYAGENELTITYTRNDAVYVPGGIYVVHLMNFCVDPQLVVAYRAQLKNGKRDTGKLPAIRNNQPVGAAKNDFVTVAIRDVAKYMDPRSRKDWWQKLP